MPLGCAQSSVLAGLSPLRPQNPPPFLSTHILLCKSQKKTICLKSCVNRAVRGGFNLYPHPPRHWTQPPPVCLPVLPTWSPSSPLSPVIPGLADSVSHLPNLSYFMQKSLWDPELHLHTLEFSKNRHKRNKIRKTKTKVPLLRHDSLEGTCEGRDITLLLCPCHSCMVYKCWTEKVLE